MNSWNNVNFGPNNPMFDALAQQSRANNFYNAPRYELIRVNGEAGARNFKMAPNSAALLLDETAPIVWLVQTDGSGLLTPTPFDIVAHQQPQQIDINNLATRVAQLEAIINDKSNSFSNKQSKKQRQQRAEASESAIDSAD